jgi:hypothetical protein
MHERFAISKMMHPIMQHKVGYSSFEEGPDGEVGEGSHEDEEEAAPDLLVHNDRQPVQVTRFAALKIDRAAYRQKSFCRRRRRERPPL